MYTDSSYSKMDACKYFGKIIFLTLLIVKFSLVLSQDMMQVEEEIIIQEKSPGGFSHAELIASLP